MLPLLTESTGITHVILAAIHLNSTPGHITLNDEPPSADKHISVWDEKLILQHAGIKVLGMLGGAAQGTFTRLDGLEAIFEVYYAPLRDMIREYGFDGLDLDVEEEMSLAGIIRLIDRLKEDFGHHFLITMAPVATALQGGPHLSGFDYEALEVMRGNQIAWYNAQFYCGWGSLENTLGFDMMIGLGWPAHKIVIGLVTNPANGSGFIAPQVLATVLLTLKEKYPDLGGIMGWEYFNSLPGNSDRPWEWARAMSGIVRRGLPAAPIL